MSIATRSKNYTAAQVIALTQRKISRMMNDAEDRGHGQGAAYLEALSTWLSNWDKRAAKRKGGLGKK